MPITPRIIDKKFVIYQAEGKVVVDDFLQVNRWVYSKVAEQISRFQLVDLTNVDELLMSEMDLLKAAAQDRLATESLGQIYIAVVVSRDQDYPVVRVWEEFADGEDIETRIFTELNLAREWLVSHIPSAKDNSRETI